MATIGTAGVSEANKAALEEKYQKAWHLTPENRAFLGARLKCEHPGYPYYETTGAIGIRFLYDSLDDFLADVGLRPGEGYALERIDMTKNFEPGNVRWSLMNDIVGKDRLHIRAERNVDSMMIRIIRTLQRHDLEMRRSKLQHMSGSAKWGAATYHEAMQRLIAMGFIEHKVVSVTQSEYNWRTGLDRKVARPITFIKLLPQNLSHNLSGEQHAISSQPSETV